MKIVCSVDREGYFTGPVAADESPLDPGKYLLAWNHIDVPAPEVPAGQRAKWSGEGWMFEPIPIPDPDPDPEVPIEPTVPISVTPRQARLALLAAGLLEPVETAIAGLSGTEGEAARISWNYATEVRRDDPLLGQITGALELTEEQIDNLFFAAVSL